MHQRFLFVLLFVVSASCFGQISSDAFTISATRNVYLQPDQVVFSLDVTADPTATLDRIVASLQSVGITAANLVSVASGSWSFTLAVAFSQMQTTVESLTALEKTILQNGSGMRLTFEVSGVQASSGLKQSQQCMPADLIADAQKQSQQLASAAGFSVGPVIAVSSLNVAPTVNTVQYAVAISGVFSTLQSFAASVPTPPTFTCSLEVQFQLLRYH